MAEIAIIIPSLEPDNKMLDLLANIRRLETRNFPILLVNDGSGSNYERYFKQAQSEYGVILLEHDRNYGKGRALRTAFDYILNQMPTVEGVITIDSDGQHTYEDMMKCISCFEEHPTALVMGVRDFQNNVPWKSEFGNKMTRTILKAVTGISLTDTQTGLRVIPRTYLKRLMKLSGDRFEYELKMIIDAAKQGVPLIEVPIATIYHNDNEGTHFQPVKDSWAIYSVFFSYLVAEGTFLKYVGSALTSFVLDLSLFYIFSKVLSGTESSFKIVYGATVFARVCSCLFNYVLNRFWVFRSNAEKSMIKYFSLVIIQMLASASLVWLLSLGLASSRITLIKVGVDIFLFLVSYQIQKHFIFKKGNEGH